MQKTMSFIALQNVFISPKRQPKELTPIPSVDVVWMCMCARLYKILYRLPHKLMIVGTSFVLMALKDTLESFNYYRVNFELKFKVNGWLVYGKLAQGKWKRECYAATSRFSDKWKSHPFVGNCVRFLTKYFLIITIQCFVDHESMDALFAHCFRNKCFLPTWCG